MDPKVKYFLTADIVTVDQFSNKTSITGVFDTLLNSFFPAISSKFCIVIGIYNIEQSADFTMQIVEPNSEIVAAMDCTLKSINLDGTATWIIPIENLPLTSRGRYTVNIIHQLNNKIIGSYFFMADFPPERIFMDGEKEKILADPTLVKGAQIKIICPHCLKEYNFELTLDPNKEIFEGFVKFPDNNILECCDGNIIDLTGIRRQIEYGFGQKLDKLGLGQKQ